MDSESMRLGDKIDILFAAVRARLFGYRRPLACHFAITNRCPWRCRYCGFRNMHTAECSTGQAVSIVNQLAERGCKRLHLTGGEPLLRKDIGAIVTAAKERGLFVTIATTGYDLRRCWDGLKDIDIFMLSFDGPEAVHDEQRGKGSYAVMTDAIKVLREKRKKYWTTTVLTDKNLDHIDFILETARANGSVANFHLLYDNGSARNIQGSFHPGEVDGDLKPAARRYADAIEYLLRRKRGDMRAVIGSSAGYLRVLRDWGDLSEVYRVAVSRRYRCRAGKLYCYIDANGDIYPCGDVMGRVAPVSAVKHGVERAFNSVSPIPCQSCIVACYTEFNLMFSLNIRTILDWAARI